MAAKKKTAKKKTKTAKKKTTKKKKVVAKKTAVKKKASKKKVAKKKAAKKTATKKKVAKKKVSSNKSSMSKKKTTKKAAKKTSAKSSKASAVKKKVSSKKSSRQTKARTDGPAEFVPYVRKKNEDYMNATQLDHFKHILLNWKQELLEEVNRTVDHMKEDASNFPDPADRATQEEEFGLELRTRDRERKLLRKINAALTRIEDGSYGYCEETGEEIGLKRLEARPVATLCLEAQERRELRKRQFRDSDDRAR